MDDRIDVPGEEYFVIEGYAHRRSQLEERQRGIPGSFIMWEQEGVPLPDGGRTPPVYALWRRSSAPNTPAQSPLSALIASATSVEPVVQLPARPPAKAEIAVSQHTEIPSQTQNGFKNTLQDAVSLQHLEPQTLHAAAPVSAQGEKPAPAPTSRTRISPKKLPRTTRHKGITRVDHPPKHAFGYLARVFWHGKLRSKFFSDKRYGDRLGALSAAIEWRNQTEAEIGKPRTNEPLVNVVSLPSNTGVRGVRRIEQEGRAFYEATWYENGRQRRTRFSARIHGEQRALELATAARETGDARRRAIREAALPPQPRKRK